MYSCEVERLLKRNGRRTCQWATVRVSSLGSAPKDGIRCRHCHGRVRVHKQRVAHGPADHVEHYRRRDSENCCGGYLPRGTFETSSCRERRPCMVGACSVGRSGWLAWYDSVGTGLLCTTTRLRKIRRRWLVVAWSSVQAQKLLRGSIPEVATEAHRPTGPSAHSQDATCQFEIEDAPGGDLLGHVHVPYAGHSTVAHAANTMWAYRGSSAAKSLHRGVEPVQLGKELDPPYHEGSPPCDSWDPRIRPRRQTFSFRNNPYARINRPPHH